MTTDVRSDELRDDLSEYLARAAEGERLLVAEDGEPKAALVSIADLRRLEAPEDDSCAGVEVAGQPAPEDGQTPPMTAEDDLAAREAAFRRALQEEGLVLRWREGPRQGLTAHEPLPVLDPPLSEQIIAERR